MRHPPRYMLTALLAAVIALSPALPILARQSDLPGIDPANMDLAADPAVDFHQYANGGWLDRTSIPSDEAAQGAWADLEDRVQQQILALLASLATRGALPADSDEAKAVRLFQQGMDLETRDAQGIAPIQPTLDEIAAIDDLEALHRFLQTSEFSGASGFFWIYAGPGRDDASRMAAYLAGPWLGMPEREFYFADDEDTQFVRDAYTRSVADAFVLLGHEPARAEDAAAGILAFERRLAEPSLTQEEWQDLSLSNNPTSVEELADLYPLMDWPAFLDARGLREVETVNVEQARYLAALDGIVRDTPLQAIKDYLTFQVLVVFRDTLSSDLEAVAFEYLGRVLQGAEEQRPLEERVVANVDWLLSDAVGRLYVAAHFSPEAKTQITALAAEVRAAFRARLSANSWMSDETRAKALEKLDRMQVKVGYPDRWRTYDEVQIADSYAMSALSAMNAETRHMLAKIGKPVDSSEWGNPPQWVNAWYFPSTNELVFTAAFLQPPFFDPAAPPEVNYGAVGAIIGHELTHGFDLQGAQFDAAGNLSDWWAADDYERFQDLNDAVVAQFGAIEVLPDLFIDGQYTVTENVADLGGVQIAYDAWQRSQATAPGGAAATPQGSAEAGNLTPEQRFFVAWATIWRENIRDEYLATLIATDSHAPDAVRAVQPLRNMDAFHEAFGIEPGDPMYLSPEERIVIW